MDKFGIFNLLNSLFNLKDNKDDGFNKENNNSEQNNFTNSSISNQFIEKQDINENKKNFVVTPPLQSSMLGTISEHDKFIARVKEKNKQK